MAEPGPVTLLVGGEAWLAARGEALRAEARGSWVRLRCDELEPGTLFAELRSYSFFTPERTLWIDRAERLDKAGRGELLEGLRDRAPGTRVYLTAQPGAKADALAKELAELPVTVEREPSRQRADAAGAARPLGLELAPEVAELLDELYAEDPLALARELEKLALLVPETGGRIDLETWRAVSSAPETVDGWRFARAVLARDTAAAVRILEQWARSASATTVGRDLLGAMGYALRQALAYRLHLAAGATPDEAARRAPGRLHPRDRQAIARWSLFELARALDALTELDRDLKRRRQAPELLLLAWCLEVTTTDQERVA